MAAIPNRVAERLTCEVNVFQKILQNAKDRDVNEADTVTIVKDMLANVFGYDKYAEITSEHSIRGTFCDLAVKLNGAVKYLIEVKAIGLTLKDNHLRQAINYGANNGIQWVILTNGLVWEVYKIKFEQPIAWELVFTLCFLEINPRRQEDQQLLFMLCKEGSAKAVIEEFHEHLQSVNRFVIGALFMSEPFLDAVRRDLRKLAPGIKVTTEEIGRIVANDVLKRDVVEGEAATKARNRVKKAFKTVKRRKDELAPTDVEENPVPIASTE